MTPRRALSWIGHRGREALLMPALLRGDGQKVAFLPSSSGTGASDLRAVRMAAELRRLGWNALCLPPQLELIQRARILRRFRPELLVFQQCRHDLNRAELSFGLPFLLDIDDADFYDPAMVSHLETMVQGARAVIAGSRHIRDWAKGLGGNAHVVWTGTPISPGARPPQAQRAPVVAWAQADPLAYPTEMNHLAEIMRQAAQATPNLIFRLYGVNSAEAHAKLAKHFDGLTLQCLPSLPYDRFLLSLRDVAVGLSPIIPASLFSRGKSFGKILGYLDAQVPVICSDQADHALFFTPGSGVVSNDPKVWIASIHRLLADAAARQAIADAAFTNLHRRLTLQAAAAKVDAVLRSVL